MGCCYNLYPEETVKDIEIAYEDDLVDDISISYGEIIGQLGKSKQIALDELHHDTNFKFIDDTISELENWSCFDQNNQKVSALALTENKNSKQTCINVSQEPYRIESKVGRNESCLCGSGKKYKKCCGQNT